MSRDFHLSSQDDIIATSDTQDDAIVNMQKFIGPGCLQKNYELPHVYDNVIYWDVNTNEAIGNNDESL